MIYLDMDGVLTDFFGGLCKLYPKLKNMFPTHNGSNNYAGFLGITKEEFWAPLEFDFWANLEWTKEGKEIYELCKSMDEVRILTAFSLNIQSPSGKMAWIKNNLPEVFAKKNIIITPHKSDLADFDRILIDDKWSNVEQFLKAGGYGICLPRPWNQFHEFETPKMVEELKNMIDDTKNLQNVLTKKLSEIPDGYQLVSVNSRVLIEEENLEPGKLSLEIEAFHLGTSPSLSSIKSLDKDRAYVVGAFYA